MTVLHLIKNLETMRNYLKPPRHRHRLHSLTIRLYSSKLRKVKKFRYDQHWSKFFKHWKWVRNKKWRFLIRKIIDYFTIWFATHEKDRFLALTWRPSKHICLNTRFDLRFSFEKLSKTNLNRISTKFETNWWYGTIFWAKPQNNCENPHRPNLF